MEHQQKRQEEHRIERQEKQALERKSEKKFSMPGRAVRPVWFLVFGMLLTLIALIIWMRALTVA